MIDIKRYCKDVDITQIDFVKMCCFKYLDGKWKRNDVHRLLARFSSWTVKEIEQITYAEQQIELYDVVDDIAIYISGCIADRVGFKTYKILHSYRWHEQEG